MKEEIFEIVDPDGKVIGKASRSECHSNPDLLHRVVHLLVFRSNGNLILQLRAVNKDIQPDKWDTSVGGHVDPGESVENAVKREMSEELGINKDIKLDFLYKYIWKSTVESELVYTFKTIYDGEIIFQREEIQKVKEWTFEEIENNTGKKLFTENFEFEWKQYLNTFCQD